MKMLHVIAKMDPELGGVCKAVRTIIKIEVEKELFHEVLSLDDPNADFIKNDGFVHHTLGPAENAWNYDKKLIGWLKNNLSNYNLVIVHGLWLYPSYAIQKVYGVENNPFPPYFVMPHGMLDPYFQKAEGRKLKAVRNWVYWKTIEKKVIEKAEGLLFTCEEEKQLASKSFKPYLPKSEIILGLGVETPPVFNVNFTKAFGKICPEALEQPYLLFLSRINEKKGVLNLIKAFLNLIDDAKTTQPMLVIAGPGMNTDYGEKIMALLQSNKKAVDKIKFIGMVENAEKWGAFYHSEAFILPSHQENFGIAIVEALSCSKPVLISNKVNIWREIEACKAGIVANDTEAGTMDLLMTWISKNNEEKKVYAQNALKCYNRNFDMRSFSEKWENLLQNLPSNTVVK